VTDETGVNDTSCVNTQPGSLAELGPPLGRGRTADVFAWSDDQVLKLFHADLAPEAINRERLVAEALNELPVAAPRYFGGTQLDGRTGLVFERINGASMLGVLARQPWRVVALGQQLAHLHSGIHAQPAPQLPSQRAYLERLIGRALDLPEHARAAALERLAGLPDGDRLCHGDFHPDNVVLSASGPVVLDWMTASRGVPAADVARTMLLLRLGAPPPGAGPVLLVFIQVLRRVFAEAYWRRYVTMSGVRQSDLAPWRLPLLTARLGESAPAAERERILALLALEG
jgi:aminoglycoside phosphotransferase (APT) family kinase protein